MNSKLFFTAVFTSLIIVSTAVYADEGKGTSPAYIRYLYNSGLYFQAIAETDRYAAAFAYPSERFSYFISMNYFMGGQYKTVINEFAPAEGEISASSLIYFYSLYNDGHAETAAEQISRADISSADPKYLDDLCYIDTMALMDGYDFRNAYLKLEKYNSIHPDEFNTGYLGLLAEYEHLRYKSPLLAGIFSAAVPGSGQVYSGRYRDGIISAVSVIGASLLTYALYDSDFRAESILTGAFTALLYTGNIYGAVNSAGYRNQTVSESFRNRIVEKLDYKFNPEEYVDYDELFSRQ